MNPIKRLRAGDWIPQDLIHVDAWVRELKTRVAEKPEPLAPPIRAFRDMVVKDPVLSANAVAMFAEAALIKKRTPLGTCEVSSFEEFLTLLNAIMTQAPEFIEYEDKDQGEWAPCGLVAFPINALLDWPMATSYGYGFFSNALVNQQFKKILNYWAVFLGTKASLYVLAPDYKREYQSCGTHYRVLSWLSSEAREKMVKVACQAVDREFRCQCEQAPFASFFNCDPDQPYYGFTSWDDFFTRTFRDDKEHPVRPVAAGEDEIANACESAPLQTPKTGVDETAAFWLKGQPYSLQDMMGFHPLAGAFIGGTVYQAFLSALSYHRWNSPVTGTIKAAFLVNGSYYLENRYTGFASADPDASAPNDSQAFLTAVATRAVIFIEADNPRIGLMCFIAVGMAEVSSCEITVKDGEPVKKGQELGMFHFGGSTHCLIFRKGVTLEFDFHNTTPGLDATNIPVCARIATVSRQLPDGI